MVKQTAGRDQLGDFAPKFAELDDDVLFGEVWSREANKKDIDRNLLKLYIEAFNMHYEKRRDIFAKKKEETLKEELANMLNNEEEKVFVIENDKEIIGYISIKINNKTTKSIWIDELMIDKDYQNKGYGKSLINKVYQYAEENNCKRIELNCWSFNENAKNFYHKQGFKEQRVIYEKNINSNN